MARARLARVVGGLALLALAWFPLAACTPAGEQGATTPGPLLPRLAARQDQVSRLVLRGAGSRELVRLQRVGGEWRVAQRAGARADAARIAQFLLQLAQARRMEAKTDQPVMYPRLGVEDIADPEAGGQELELSGKDIGERVVFGKEHKLTGGRYARLHGQARSWLIDLDAGFEPDPVAWIEHRLLDVPLARVGRVRIQPRSGTGFSLLSLDDRFRPDDAPPAAMGDSHAGDEIASALQAFDIDDVAPDDQRVAERKLDYELVDGSVLAVSIWREGPRDWARLSASLDPARASAWAQQARRPQRIEEAKAQVREWNRRFAGRRYLLPEALATTLMRDHAQILEGEPPEPTSPASGQP
jgi:hypothetical protein